MNAATSPAPPTSPVLKELFELASRVETNIRNLAWENQRLSNRQKDLNQWVEQLTHEPDDLGSGGDSDLALTISEIPNPQPKSTLLQRFTGVLHHLFKQLHPVEWLNAEDEPWELEKAVTEYNLEPECDDYHSFNQRPIKIGQIKKIVQDNAAIINNLHEISQHFKDFRNESEPIVKNPVQPTLLQFSGDNHESLERLKKIYQNPVKTDCLTVLIGELKQARLQIEEQLARKDNQNSTQLLESASDIRKSSKNRYPDHELSS